MGVATSDWKCLFAITIACAKDKEASMRRASSAKRPFQRLEEMLAENLMVGGG